MSATRSQNGNLVLSAGRMALQASTKRFQVQLSNVDAGVYATLDLRLAQQPSENDRFLFTRLLAFCYLYRDDDQSVLAFSKGGIATPDDPAIARHSLDGRLLQWCEVGNPSAERLHKASKSAPEVFLFTQHDPDRVVAELARAEIHRREELLIYALEPSLLDQLAAALSERGGNFDLTIAEQTLYATAGAQSCSGALTRVSA
jgi:uncharacterized protein YaeQ